MSPNADTAKCPAIRQRHVRRLADCSDGTQCNCWSRVSRLLQLLLLLILLVLVQTPAGADTAAGVPSHPGSSWSNALDFYQSFISRADGNRCPMTPSCSEYAKQAFRKYGFIKGWILTCDRLLRCGRDEIRLAPSVRVAGTLHAYDPLGANTFWWKQK